MTQGQGIILEGIESSGELMEQVIIQSMFKLENVRETLIPYLTPSIFQNSKTQEVYKRIDSFMKEFEKFPTYKDMTLITADRSDIKDHFTQCFKEDISEYNQDHILGHIEQYIKKSLYQNTLAHMMEEMYDPHFKVKADSPLPEDLRNIFSFSFDNSIGLNLFSEEGMERMIDFFHQASNFIPSGIVGLDAMLGGGFHSKTLNLFMLPTNMGKSAIMCAIAANMVMAGYNVLYVTLEMSEEMIAQRIMSNIFDIEQNTLKTYDKPSIIRQFKQIAGQVKDKFRVKEYPTSSMTSNVIRRLNKEYKEKQGFEPHVIFVDYLELMKPNHVRKVSQKHEDLRTVSEELRDVGIEEGVPVVSAMQTNREGYAAKELDLNDMSGSFGVAMTADFVCAGILTEQNEAAKEYTLRSAKNRFGPKWTEFNVGIDFAKMKLNDLGQLPVTSTGEEVKSYAKPASQVIPTQQPINNPQQADKFDAIVEETKKMDETNNFCEELGTSDYITYNRKGNNFSNLSNYD